MRDAKVAILEDQIDALAGRIADVEEQYRRLPGVLTTDPTLMKLGLDARMIELRCAVIKGLNGEKGRHRQERRDLLARAEFDEFRRRVARAESLADLTGQSFADAWEAARKDPWKATRDADDREDDDEESLGRTPLTPHQTVWDQALAHLATVLNRYSFLTWFRETSLVRDDGAALVVRAVDGLTASWLTTRYADVVAAALSAVGRPDTRVTFVGEDAPRV